MKMRLPWLLWASAVGLVVPGLAGTVLTWTGPLPVAAAGFVFALLALGAATMGAIVATRMPRNAIGWILLAIGGGLGVWMVSGAYAHLGATTALDPLPGHEYAAWAAGWLPIPVIGGLHTFLLLLFPDGALPSRRWRWVGYFAAIGVVLGTIAFALLPGEVAPGVDNPVALSGSSPESFHWLEAVSDWLAPPVMLTAAAALIVRLRRSRGVERQQLKSFTYTAAFACIGITTGVVVPPGATSDTFLLIGMLALAGLPITAGLAILRYRLYAIDVVINRTIVYGALTVTLGGAYLGSILLLQLGLRPLTQESSLAVAVSTLAVAALFRPLRARIQAVVDRRFYRRRYDAAQTLEGFGLRLRNELDLDALATDLHTVVGDTMQPTHVSLWLRSPR